LADFTTSRCVLAISFLEALGVAPGLLFQREQPDIDAQQRLGDFILKFTADFLRSSSCAASTWCVSCRRRFCS
jgi:hypothetical protein